MGKAIEEIERSRDNRRPDEQDSRLPCFFQMSISPQRGQSEPPRRGSFAADPEQSFILSETAQDHDFFKSGGAGAPKTRAESPLFTRNARRVNIVTPEMVASDVRLLKEIEF